MIKKTFPISAKNMLLFFFCLFLSLSSFAQKPVEPPAEPKWVLIDGIKWATCNVDVPGTFVAKPEDAGMFYQWNSKIGWSITEPMISSDAGATWNDSEYDSDTWEKVNDPCPLGWRVPTRAEYLSLAGLHDAKWTTINDVKGWLFGSDDNLLFLPVAGCCYNKDRVSGVDRMGKYWTSTPPYTFTFESMGVGFGMGTGQGGHSVRCVAE